MQSEQGQDIVEVAAQVAGDHLERSERETARDLLSSAFYALPWELKELYQDYLELYRNGDREEASELFEAWMDRARDLGLL